MNQTPPDTVFASSLAGIDATWLVTGVAGFIGSNLLETLLKWNQRVVGLDNFATGSRRNLLDVRAQVSEEQWARFRLIEGDVADPQVCAEACQGAQYILHQAALGSVPRSLKAPLDTYRANVTGFVTLLEAARAAGIQRMVYASSSSVYGDHPDLPKVEDTMGNVLSPYAATKLIDEVLANTWGRCYGMQLIGLRYFNVFGRRQDPDGAYAAVIPRWIAEMLRGGACYIHGDGETSRDFCYIANVCQMNIKAALVQDPAACNRAYNVAYGQQMTLNELHQTLRAKLPGLTAAQREMPPVYDPFRPGDIRHSLADISAARQLIGYLPTHTAMAGLSETLAWYAQNLVAAKAT